MFLESFHCISFRKSDAKLLCFSGTTPSTSGIIVKGPHTRAPWVGLLMEELCLHSDFSSKLPDNTWVHHIFTATGTCGPWELQQVTGRVCGALWVTALSLGQLKIQPRAACGTSQLNVSRPAAPTAHLKYYSIPENIIFFLENCLFSCKIVHSVIAQLWPSSPTPGTTLTTYQLWTF